VVETPPPDPRGRGTNLAMLLALVILVAGLVGWAYQRNPPSEPSAAGTVLPDAVPGGGGNTARPD
jgi:hypothetical protein